MAFDIARIVISATTVGIEESLGKISQLETATKGVMKALSLVGGGAAAAYALHSWASATVAAASGLDDLSDATGSSVENLSRLANQAKVAGTPFETLEGLMLKLSAGMGGTSEEAQRVQRTMAALGVSARDPAQALNEVAVKLSQFSDGVEKAALARDLFGKGGPAFLATLKDVAEAQDIGATVTRQQAAEAERLEKSWRRLSFEAGGLRDALLNQIVPALAGAIEGFQTARRAGLSFFQSLDFVGDTSMESLGISLRRVRGEIDEVQKTLANAELVKNDPFHGAQARAQIAHATKALDDLIKRKNVLLELERAGAMRGAAALGDTGDASDRALQAERLRREQAELARIRAAIGGVGGEGGKQQLSEFARMLADVKGKAAEAELALARAFDDEPIVEAEKALARLFMSPAFKALSESEQIELLVEYDSWIQYQKELAKAKKALDEVRRAEEELAKLRDELEAASGRRLQAAEGETAALLQQLEQLEAEGEQIGLTKQQLDLLTLSRLDAKIATLEQAAAARESVAGMDAETAAMYVQLQVLRKIREQTANNQGAQASVDSANRAAEAWKSAAASIEQSLTDALLRGFESGADFAKNFRDTLYNMFRTLVLRPVISAIMAPIAGGLGGLLPGTANAGGMGGAGGGFSLDGLLSTGSSLFNSLSSGGIFSAGLGASFATSAVGQGLGLSVAMGAGEGIALTALGSTLGTAIPILGAALMVANMLGAFDKDPDKTKGQFGFLAGTTGFEDNQFTKTPFGNIGFMDANTQQFDGAGAQVFNQVVAGTLQAFADRMNEDQIALLSGRLQGLKFDEMEDEYTTEDWLKKFGAEILDKVISESFAVLDPQLQAVFDAFDGAADEMAEFANVLLTVHDLTENIPTSLRETLISALDGTEEVSEQVIAFATAYGTLQEVMNRDPVEDALDGLARANASAYESLQMTADAFGELIEAYDGSAEASLEIAEATAAYYNQLVQVIAGIRQLGQSIDAMFGGTIEDLTLQTLDDDQKKQYYQNQIALLYGQLGTAVDPAEIDRITKQINEYMRAAFGLLTPDEQTSLLSQYTDFARQVNELAQQRLVLAEAQAQRQADLLFTTLRSVMEKVAADMAKAAADQKAAAATMQQAANTIQDAANTPQVVTLGDPTVNG